MELLCEDEPETERKRSGSNTGRFLACIKGAYTEKLEFEANLKRIRDGGDAVFIGIKKGFANYILRCYISYTAVSGLIIKHYRESMKRLKSLIILLLITGLSCNLVQTLTERDENILPAETDLPGWRIIRPKEEYTVKNIENYLKDKETIELLQAYGFRKLLVSEYKSSSTPVKTITVEIFQMSSPLNAFGILTSEVPYDTPRSALCDDSFSDVQGMFGRKGNYYIRIESGAQYKNASDDYKMFMDAVCDNIKTSSGAIPDYAAMFKRGTRLSVKYKIKGSPELPAVKNIFTKKMEFDKGPRIIFWGKRSSGYISLGEFSKLLKDKKNSFVMSSAGKLQTAFNKTDDNEFIFVSVYKEWIFGVIDAEDLAEGEKIISFIFNEIADFSNK